MDDHCEQIDQIAWSFEDAWDDQAAASSPRIEDYLPAAPDLRRLVLWELVEIELEVRRKRGEEARVDEFLERFPELHDDPFRLVEFIFSEYRLRRQKELQLRLADYSHRFPSLYDHLVQYAQAKRGGRAAPSRLVRFKCSHCGSPITLTVLEHESLATCRCPDCDKLIEPDAFTTLSWRSPNLPRLGRFDLVEVVGITSS